MRTSNWFKSWICLLEMQVTRTIARLSMESPHAEFLQKRSHWQQKVKTPHSLQRVGRFHVVQGEEQRLQAPPQLLRTGLYEGDVPGGRVGALGTQELDHPGSLS